LADENARLFGCERGDVDDRIDRDRDGFLTPLARLELPVTDVDVPQVAHGGRMRSQMPRGPIDAAAELDLVNLRAHQHRSQSVLGGEPHPCQPKSSPARSTKIPWNTSPIVIVTSIAGSPDSFKPPTI